MRTTDNWLWPSLPGKPRCSARYVALIVAAAFAGFGLVWVLFTDILLYAITRDQVLIARIETAKGWTFVGIACIFLYVVTFRSVSRVSRAHVIISTIVDSIADGVVVLGRDRTVMYANSAALRMLRCEDPHELAEMRAIDFSRRYRVSYPDGSLVPPDQLIVQRVFTEGGPLHYKAVLHPPGGQEAVVSATAAAVRENARDPADLVVSVMHDITESEQMERLRDQFFAAAAHSLKTPIAIIKANLQVLWSDSAPQLRRAAAAVERQCSRIDRLVQNMLVLSRARSRTLQLYPERLELGPLVAQIAREMAVGSSEHEVRIELSDSPSVHADHERLATVLRNLIDEGCRASISGSPITVRLRSLGGEAEIGVRYQPRPPEDQAGDVYGEYDDRGISRCVVKIIVEAHGGTVGEERVGSEMIDWIRLPAIEGGLMNTARYVLIVDDDPDMVEIMAFALNRAGYATRCAENGAQALALVAAQVPALVLLDMLMPVMDGWQCARELRARYGRGVPIVVVSAAEHARARGEEIGADDALSKPFEMGDLLTIVARHFPEPASHR